MGRQPSMCCVRSTQWYGAEAGGEGAGRAKGCVNRCESETLGGSWLLPQQANKTALAKDADNIHTVKSNSHFQASSDQSSLQHLTLLLGSNASPDSRPSLDTPGLLVTPAAPVESLLHQLSLLLPSASISGVLGTGPGLF